MKRLLPFLFAFLLCFSPASVGADAPDAADSDALFRLQLRLCDLGYLTGYPSGVHDEGTALAIERYLADSGASSMAEAHAPGAKPVPVRVPENSVTLTGIMGQPGVRIDWPYVREMLTAGATYVLTNCESGAIAHVKYVGGESHAEIVPVSNWDQATISGMFAYAQFMDKQPVTLTVGSYRVAASLKGSVRRTAEDEACYCLYFWGSDSGIAAIPDAEHILTLRRATRD